MDIKGTSGQASQQIKQRIGSQLDPVPLSPLSTGVRYGDQLMLQSNSTMGYLATSLGQPLGGSCDVPRHLVSCCRPGQPVARCVLTLDSYGDEARPGDVVKY